MPRKRGTMYLYSFSVLIKTRDFYLYTDRYNNDSFLRFNEKLDWTRAECKISVLVKSQKNIYIYTLVCIPHIDKRIMRRERDNFIHTAFKEYI